MKKYILYGSGRTGAKALEFYGRDNVAFFCNSFHHGDEKYGVKVISYDQMEELYKKERYRVIVSIEEPGYQSAVRKKLDEAGITYEIYSELIFEALHVHGEFPNLSYDYPAHLETSFRVKNGTIPMLQEMFSHYQVELEGAFIDFYIYFGDKFVEAERIRRKVGRSFIFAYSAVYGMEQIVAIPDYNFYYGIGLSKNASYYTNAIECLRTAGRNPWKCNQVFWAGNPLCSDFRIVLQNMMEKHPDKIFSHRTGELFGEPADGTFIPLDECYQYKYLLDIRGYGWTDRVKYLLASGRPLMLAYRPYKEYYFDKLIPMKHYVPVKEDLSDLLAQMELLDNNQSLYDEIVANANQFVDENFTKEKIREDLFNQLFANQIR